jgi:hypothetical protein
MRCHQAPNTNRKGTYQIPNFDAGGRMPDVIARGAPRPIRNGRRPHDGSRLFLVVRRAPLARRRNRIVSGSGQAQKKEVAKVGFLCSILLRRKRLLPTKGLRKKERSDDRSLHENRQAKTAHPCPMRLSVERDPKLCVATASRKCGPQQSWARRFERDGSSDGYALEYHRLSNHAQ